MPHQCVRCNKFYEDGSSEILKGCSCGARLFFFVKKEKLKQAEEITSQLTQEEKAKIEEDILDIIGQKEDEEDQPVILDLETIRILKPGKFEIDLVHLFKKDPLIYKTGDGKYFIDIAETFKTFRERKEK